MTDLSYADARSIAYAENALRIWCSHFYSSQLRVDIWVAISIFISVQSLYFLVIIEHMLSAVLWSDEMN